MIALPKPRQKGPMSVEQSILRRRSVREFDPESLELHLISQLLWSAQGITSERGFRAAPSAGRAYPIELYLACAEGLFHYRPGEHALVKVLSDDIRAALARQGKCDGFVAQAPVSLIFAAVYERTTNYYGERGVRYAHLDIGHAAENVHLQGEALGLGSCGLGAFDDAAVARVLSLPAEQKPVYVIPVGRARVR
jgi:SagB-type dehydrogenase family enzyme